MIRQWALAAVVASLSLGCATRVILTDDVGVQWDGHLDVGERMSFGAEAIEPCIGAYDVHPATHVVSEAPAIVAVEQGPYGVELVGRARGRARLRLSFADTDDRAVVIVVE